MTIESLLSSMGLRCRIIDDEAWMVCPYHRDQHPSFSINTRSGVFYCFACGAKGSLAKFIADMNGVSYANAVITANDIVGHARMNKWKEEQDNISFSPMSLKVTEADMALFTDPPQEALDSKHVTLEATHHYGIKWNTVHNTWIFPYHDPCTNEIWGWQEKNSRIFRNYPAGTKKSRTLFGYAELSYGNAVVLVESPIDCAVVHSAGIADAVSTFGVPTGTYQLELLQRKRSHTLILALDNDKAGIDGTRNLIPEAVKMFKRVQVANYQSTSAKDVGEMNKTEIYQCLEGNADPALLWMQNDLHR